jgi:hypothetical protein
MKIVSKCPRRYLVRLEGKMKLTKKEKIYVVVFSVPVYQSSTDFSG